MSESQCDAVSSLPGSDDNDKRDPGILTLGIRRFLAGPLSRRQIPSQPFCKRDRICNNHDIKRTTRLTTSDDSNTRKAIEHQLKPKEKEFRDDARIESSKKQHYVDDTSCGPVGCFSKFNCLRNSNNDPATKTRKARVSVMTKPSPQTSMASFSEEDEKRWLAYSMKPIEEDQSLGTGSIISMSAPLLSPLSSQLIDINNKT